MTGKSVYNVAMLLSVQGKGALFSLCVIILCVAAICAGRLFYLGYRTLVKKLPPQKPKIEEQEPVYYIVEKKKKPAKTQYSKPKKIKFDK